MSLLKNKLRFSDMLGMGSYAPFDIISQSFPTFLCQKGSCPESIAQRVMPRAHTSLFSGSYLPSTNISGAAQQGDPQLVFNLSPALQKLPRPKSISLREFWFTIIFSGFMSLWQIPFACRKDTALNNWQKQAEATFSLRKEAELMTWKSYCPSASSVTKQYCFSVSYICSSLMMLGCSTAFKILISLSTKMISFLLLILDFSKILIATDCPERRWVPFLTFPKVPWPMVFPMVKSPIFFFIFYNFDQIVLKLNMVIVVKQIPIVSLLYGSTQYHPLYCLII